MYFAMINSCTFCLLLFSFLRCWKKWTNFFVISLREPITGTSHVYYRLGGEWREVRTLFFTIVLTGNMIHKFCRYTFLVLAREKKWYVWRNLKFSIMFSDSSWSLNCNLLDILPVLFPSEIRTRTSFFRLTLYPYFLRTEFLKNFQYPYP